MANSGSPEVIEIVSLCDDLLLPWLDLYESAFPPEEKVPVSSHLGVLKRRSVGGNARDHLLAAVQGEQLVGMARYSVAASGRAAYLWYLAITPLRRSQGLGGWFFQKIVERARQDSEQLEALVWEVEIPGQTQDRVGAERRLSFYRRQGARLLSGIAYNQQVPNQPPIPMHLMLQPLCSLTPAAALALVREVVGGEVRVVGDLALS